MGQRPQHRLSTRERQILDAVYALREATARDVVDHLREPDAYDSIRVILANLEKKGLLAHDRDGRQHVYFPSIPGEKARTPAMKHLLETFFAGSSSRAILAFLEVSKDELTREELDRIAAWIEEQAAEHGKDR